MKRVFMGHRGVGKSSLLQRHKEYFPGVPAFDLDREVENHAGKKIADIFSNEGELAFRRYEREVFKQIINLDNFVIAVGGGFNPEHIPTEIETIFLSRRTDVDGRIFLNRPKINSDLSDLEDSLTLYKARHLNFLKRADFIYQMPEGIKEFDQIEFQILSGGTTESVKSYLTIHKNNSSEMQHNLLELRTDIFSHDEILKIIRQFPEKEFLVSFRSKENTQLFDLDNEKIICDWGLELGDPPEDFLNFRNMISIHNGSLQDCIEELRLYPQALLKLCPVIDSWEELVFGYRWQQENPTARSFLPRTAEGASKYRWFRILASHFQKINFVQGFAEIDDQPSWYELLKHQASENFGAVLGNPIHHSRSVTEQDVIAVPLEEKDFMLAMSFLTELGMNRAAVTSPLKTIAGEVNSLVLKTEKKNKQDVKAWIGTSTDQYGFKKLIEQISMKPSDLIAVWGGSGVIGALKKEVPYAQFFSARTGRPKDGSHHTDPRVIIWAAPRMESVKMPFEVYPQWNPQIILDLNYTDNSLGIECAKKYNCQYISGLEMFLEQACYQREFWKENL
jgi:shikimate kinase